jgi:hypothetical protein
MALPTEPLECSQAARAWAAGNYDTARRFYRLCSKVAATGSLLPPAFYLSSWARKEGSIGNRDAFEALHHEALSLEPSTPYWRLLYAQDAYFGRR